ncbi:hypothetical protein BASA83_013585 [Batrachochytrium salamandrivorans]|nr:hypothetical protein BASA83_013585 [Batrachochytrium salamandrivorans]
MLGHGLTTLVHGKRDRWDEYLPQVLLALRTRTTLSIIKSLVRLNLLEDENKKLKVDAQESRVIANRAILEKQITNSAPTSTLEPKASLPDKFDGTRRNFRGFIINSSSSFNFKRVDTTRIEKDRYARNFIKWKCTIVFYHGLSSEIKDALVHFDNPSSVSAAMDLAIRIDNRLLNVIKKRNYLFRDPLTVIFQQLQLLLALEISSNN